MALDDVRFGDVVIDVPARELRRDGEHQHLEPQAFDVLVALVEARDRVVAKSELLDLVWGDQFVSESALTTRIKEVRRAVGDDGTRQEVIRNVRGRGYRFVAEIGGGGEPGSSARNDLVGARPAPLGREREVAAVAAALETAPVVTIVGPGGIGKTTVARAVADATTADGDGAVFVRLTPVTDPTDVVFAARRAAGIRGAVGDDEEVLSTLAPLDTLVVLDNCEHVVSGAADLAKRFVERGARARVLATSRERLGVAGEQVVALDVLDRDTARELFATRARAVRPDFELDDRTIPDVDRIVARVDRLPLAVEMAAARLSAIELGELADLLDERLDVLRSPDRSVDERHRTLAGLVAWSTELLEPRERRVMDAFSVFASGVTASDVAGVLGSAREAATTDAGALDAVLGLVDRSLLVAETARRPTRYRMLSTVRAHVGDGEVDDGMRRRHARWFTDVAVDEAGRLDSPEEAAAHERLDGVVAELRAAHRWARRRDPQLAARLTGALDRYAHTRLWSEPALWAEELAADPTVVGPAACAVHAAIAAQACHRADEATARAHVRRVIPDPDDLPEDATGVASALESLADIALYSGRLAESFGYATALRHHGERVGDGYALATGICGEALALTYEGQVDAALSRLEEAPTAELPPSGSAWLAYAAGEARAVVDPESSIADFERALTLAGGVSNHFVRTVTSTSLLSARSRAADPAGALPAFDAVLRDFRRYGCRTHSATALRNLVDVLARAGHDEAAMVLLGSLEGAAKSTYGAELERLEAARDTVTARVGHDRVSAWVASGAERAADPSAAVDLALAHLATIIESG